MYLFISSYICIGTIGCYSFGSNSHGQLGVSNPSLTECSLVPIKIPLPEGLAGS